MIRAPKPICRHPLVNMVTITLTYFLWRHNPTYLTYLVRESCPIPPRRQAVGLCSMQQKVYNKILLKEAQATSYRCRVLP